MTHTIHRRGDRKSLKEDYVVLVRQNNQPEASAVALKIMADHNPIGLIKRRKEVPLRYMKNWNEGLDKNELINNPEPPSYIAGLYSNKESVEGVVKDLAKADLGLPITLSGIIDDISEICENARTEPHTIMLSLEAIGRTELLPDDKILEITTMCGHGLINRHLVRHLVNKVRKAKISAEEAGIEIGKLCICNSFNHLRAGKIIKEYVKTSR